jgi:hypothetical protein
MTKEFPQAMMALASSEVDNTKLTTTKSFKTSRCAPPGYEYVRPYDHTKDGRQAYCALCAHYQGRQTHNSLAGAVMSTLSSTNIDGRKGGLTLKSYYHKMRKAMSDLNEFGGSEARLGPCVVIKFFP